MGLPVNSFSLEPWASQVMLVVKNSPINAGNIRDKGSIPGSDREDLLKKTVAIHSTILAWKIPWTEEPGGLQFKGSHLPPRGDATTY